MSNRTPFVDIFANREYGIKPYTLRLSVFNLSLSSKLQLLDRGELVKKMSITFDCSSSKLLDLFDALLGGTEVFFEGTVPTNRLANLNNELGQWGFVIEIIVGEQLDPAKELRQERQDQLAALLKEIPQQSQRQDSTLDQLLDLIAIANRCGLYDAADYIRSQVEVWQRRNNETDLRAYRRAGGELDSLPPGVSGVGHRQVGRLHLSAVAVRPAAAMDVTDELDDSCA